MNTPALKRPALAIKSITGQTQFLVPVQHTSNKSKLIVVPKHHGHHHQGTSSTSTTTTTNSHQQRVVLNYLKPVLKIPTIHTSHDNHHLNSHHRSGGGGHYHQPLRTNLSSNQSLHSRVIGHQLVSMSGSDGPNGSQQSLLVRSGQPKSPKVSPAVATGRTFGGQSSLVRPVQASAVKQLTEKQSKDLFMMTLGLVTKESLAELQSRKYERKRRTTANPQFSSAALEAKRFAKQEIAERKAKRRLLNNGLQDNGLSSTGGGSLATSNAHKTTATSITPTALSTRNTGSAAAAIQAKTNASANSNGNTGSAAAAADHNPKAIGIEPQEISPGLHIVTKIGKSVSALCNECNELCECDCDSILYCRGCKSLFHAMCTTTRQDIIKYNRLPHCLRCDSHRKRVDELLARKREERDNLMVKRKEMEDQLQQMKRALQQLKLKIREKNEEKVSLVANHEIVQQKVDKIIDTLKLVEDTNEWEDDNEEQEEVVANDHNSHIDMDVLDNKPQEVLEDIALICEENVLTMADIDDDETAAAVEAIEIITETIHTNDEASEDDDNSV